MKVSINWVRDINRRYRCSADPMPDGIDTLVQKIGAQLGAVDEVIDLGKKYEGIVVAKVVSCQKHPNADKLSVCLIDDGGVVKGLKRDKDGLVQVVCGAPNARATLAVAWIPPGVAVPASYDKEPYVLESREIRGQMSNGMLASPKELALGENHEGILEIDVKAEPGQAFAEVYGLNDYVIDIENKMFTHRPDLFGMLGVARELAGIQNHVFKSPDWYRQDAQISKPKNGKLDLGFENQVTDLVPRFMLLPISGVSIRQSPVWLQSYLARVGIRPINNIVDITNFLMMETAQPLHAYDYDKVKALSGGEAKIEVRQSRENEKLKLLGGKAVNLKKGAVVIATPKLAIGLGGVMGGAETEVDENTRNIILEAGTFDMNATRKTAMTYGLFTDAATRFTKNQSPLQNKAVMARAAEMVTELAGGRIGGQLVDEKTIDGQSRKVKVSTAFINQRLGLDLSPERIRKLLENVEFEVGQKDGMLTVSAPFWRTDIAIAEDIVEEVGRLYGYDHLPLELPKRDISPAAKDPLLAFKDRLRQAMVRAGANEVLTYSFVHGSLIDSSGQDKRDAYHIRNALSPDLQYYRLSLTPSLLEKVHHNIKSGFEEFGLFETGKAHVRGVLDGEKLPVELERFSLVVASKNKREGAAYYWAKRHLENLALTELYVTGLKYVPLKETEKLPKEWEVAAKAYEPVRSAVVYAGNKLLGLIGEPTARLKTSLKLPKTIAMFELDSKRLLELTPPLRPYFPLNRFPSVEQDITLKVKAELSYEKVTSFAMSVLENESSQKGYKFIWRPLDIYQKQGDEGHKHITWRVVLSHPERTLTTEETNTILDVISAKTAEKFGTERI